MEQQITQTFSSNKTPDRYELESWDSIVLHSKQLRTRVYLKRGLKQLGGVLGTYIGVQDDLRSKRYKNNRPRIDLVETDSDSSGLESGQPALGPGHPVQTGPGTGW